MLHLRTIHKSTWKHVLCLWLHALRQLNKDFGLVELLSYSLLITTIAFPLLLFLHCKYLRKTYCEIHFPIAYSKVKHPRHICQCNWVNHAALLQSFRGQHSEKRKGSARGNWDPREVQQPFRLNLNGVGDRTTTLRRLLICAVLATFVINTPFWLGGWFTPPLPWDGGMAQTATQVHTINLIKLG